MIRINMLHVFQVYGDGHFDIAIDQTLNCFFHLMPQHPGTGRSCRRKGFVAAQWGKDSGADTLQRHLPGKRHQRKSPNRQKRQKREVHLRRKINSTHFTKGCHQYGHPFVLYIHRLHRLIEKISKTCKNLQ